LSDEQEELYAIAELGLLDTGEDPDSDAMNILSSLVMVQQAANAPELLSNEEGVPFEGISTKMEVLVEQLKDELEGIKVMIFSRFEKMISLIEKRLKKEKIECVRITGKETSKEREEAKKTYQNMNSGINVMLITTAGSESLNLQSTEHIIMIDSPWSWGDYVQLTGRAVRIGSQHKVVIVTHLIARKKDGSKTIDQHVIKKLRSKKALADKVAGENLKSGLQFIESDDAMDLFRMIREEKSTETLLQKVNKKIQSTSDKAKKKAKSKKKAKNLPTAEPAAVLDVDFSDI
jgi:SNF2 family DNA or RNA helicase